MSAKFLRLAALMLLVAVSASSQITTGTIVGVIEDSSGTHGGDRLARIFRTDQGNSHGIAQHIDALAPDDRALNQEASDGGYGDGAYGDCDDL